MINHKNNQRRAELLYRKHGLVTQPLSRRENAELNRLQARVSRGLGRKFSRDLRHIKSLVPTERVRRKRLARWLERAADYCEAKR